MASVNKVILVGNLGADPEMKYTQASKAVCNLRLATNEVFKDKGGQKQERVEWHRVTVWGDQAENCAKYLTKGSAVYLEGKLQTRAWDDKDGQKRYSTEIHANHVVFLGSPSGERGERTPPQSLQPKPKPSSRGEELTPAPSDDDIPF
jgi:single-strand DNA-binding protein